MPLIPGENQSRRIIVWLVIGLNAVPVIGALFFGWRLFFILSSYWLMIAIAGFFNVLLFFYETLRRGVRESLFYLIFNGLTYVFSVFLVGLMFFYPNFAAQLYLDGSAAGVYQAMFGLALLFAVGYGAVFFLVVWREEPDDLTVLEQVVLSTFIIWLQSFIVSLGGSVATVTAYFYRGLLGVFAVKTAVELYYFSHKLKARRRTSPAARMVKAVEDWIGRWRPDGPAVQPDYLVILKYAGIELGVILSFFFFNDILAFFQIEIPAAVTDTLMLLAVFGLFGLPFFWGRVFRRPEPERAAGKEAFWSAVYSSDTWQWPGISSLITTVFCAVILFGPVVLFARFYGPHNWQKLNLVGTRYKVERNMVYYSPKTGGAGYWQFVPGANASTFQVFYGPAGVCPDASDGRHYYCRGKTIAGR